MKHKVDKKILKKIKSGDIKNIKDQLLALHPADIAEILNNIDSQMQEELFDLIPPEIASEFIVDLNQDVLDNIMLHLNKEELIEIVDEMDTDEATDLLNDLEDNEANQLLNAIGDNESEDIKRLLKYDEESAGGIMQTEIFSVQESSSVNELVDILRENAEMVENAHYVFVTDHENRLKGYLNLVDLLLNSKYNTAKQLMKEDVISVNVNIDQEEVAHIFRKYDLYVIPVVDANDKLLGRITVDDIIDIIDDEASEDAYKMVGLENEDRVFTSPIKSVKKRLPWLVMNLFTALIISSVVGIFESTIATFSVLAVLMPIVAGLGGNAGIQTLTVITRGIALGEMTIHNTWKAISKEITVGVINGLIMGTAASLIAYLLKGDPIIGLVLGLALICNMFIAGLVGSFVPVIMKKMNIDPALASSVVITMLTDIGGYASFLGLATWVML